MSATQRRLWHMQRLNLFAGLAKDEIEAAVRSYEPMVDGSGLRIDLRAEPAALGKVECAACDFRPVSDITDSGPGWG